MGQELRQVFLVLPSAEQIETNDEILIINVYTNFYFELGLVELKKLFSTGCMLPCIFLSFLMLTLHYENNHSLINQDLLPKATYKILKY